MAVDDTQPLISHLIELRTRLLRSLICVIVLFLALVYFSNNIYEFISAPLVDRMPAGATMISTNVPATFLAPIKLTLIVAVLLSAPYILYQIWAFIAPALYRHERRLMMPLIFSSTALFYLGMAFAYFVVFPIAFSFFINTSPSGVVMSTDINSYLDFVMALFVAFGVSFEVPIAIVLLCWSGATTPDDLRKKRPYIIVGAFVIGMLLTPPDVLSQTLLAIPMCILFEIGLFFARFYVGQGRRNAEDESVDDDEKEDARS
jgi:sec-independent protein translocase protein TatC